MFTAMTNNHKRTFGFSIGVVALTALIVLAVEHKQIQYPAGQNLFPPDVSNTLEHADEFTLLSLDPVDVPGKQAGTNRFHEYDVLGELPVRSPAERERLLKALFEGVSKDAIRTWCFSPRHGIRAKAGTNITELVICFECGQVYFYGASKGRVLTHATPAAVFNAVLTNAHIPLSRQPDEHH